LQDKMLCNPRTATLRKIIAIPEDYRRSAS